MPRIELITNVEYQSLWPYDSYYDNLPVKNILTRLDLVNSAVDLNEEILTNSAGTSGSLVNRLDQSIEADGDLKSAAIDEALHSIGAHTDGEYDGIDYVRMTAEERDKLETVAESATAITLTADGTTFTDEEVELIDSDTVSWEVVAPNKIKANFAFSEESAHAHYYDLTPVHSDIDTPNYQDYLTTSMSTAFIEGTLRVYVNGVRLSESNEVYVYTGSDGPLESWTLLGFTGDAEGGTFSLTRAIDDSDIITIDFDQSLV